MYVFVNSTPWEKNKDGKTRHRGIDVASRFAPLPRKKAMASVEKLF